MQSSNLCGEILKYKFYSQELFYITEFSYVCNVKRGYNEDSIA
nr:MAG TPA: hypothetical protein [Caudoviricetes sp.]